MRNNFCFQFNPNLCGHSTVISHYPDCASKLIQISIRELVSSKMNKIKCKQIFLFVEIKFATHFDHSVSAHSQSSFSFGFAVV